MTGKRYALLVAPWACCSLVIAPCCIILWFWRTLGEQSGAARSNLEEGMPVCEHVRQHDLKSRPATATSNPPLPTPPWLDSIKGCGIILTFLAVIAFWFLDFELGIVSMVGACTAMVVCWEQVYDLYEAHFTGPTFLYILFIIPTVTGFINTGVPSEFFNFVSPYLSTSRSKPGGLTLLILVVCLIVQIMSNVPAVFILGKNIATIAMEEGSSSKQGYLLCAFCTAISGSLTPPGSISQKILYDAAARATEGKVLVSFLDHLIPNVFVVSASLAVGVNILLSLPA